jgi:uncharacterized protein YukE
MQEQQGNIEEPLSGLPGPRPFNKNNKKGVPMEDNNKELNDIVAKTTEAISGGKAFGGWTDNVEEQSVWDKAMSSMNKDALRRSKEARKKLGARPTAAPATAHRRQKDKSGTLKGLMSPEKKGTKVGVLSHVEHDGNDIQELEKSTLKSYIRGASQDKADQAYAAGQNVQKVQSATRGQDASAPAKAHDYQQRKMKRRARGISKALRKLGDHVEHDGESVNEKPTYDVHVSKYETDHPDDAKRLPKKLKVHVPKDVKKGEETEDRISDAISDKTGFLHHGFSYEKSKKQQKESVATHQRQLKNPKKEMLVVDKKGKVSTIDKKDWNRYKKQGYGIAEGIGSAIGGAIGSVVPGVGTAIGSVVGGLAGKMFKKKKQAGESSTT